MDFGHSKKSATVGWCSSIFPRTHKDSWFRNTTSPCVDSASSRRFEEKNGDVIGPVLGMTTVRLEISIATDDGALATALGALRKAIAHRRDGRHDDAVAAARVALDELSQAGFGGHAPNTCAALLELPRSAPPS